MLPARSISLLCLSQLFHLASPLPTDQQILRGQGWKNVQIVRAELKKAQIIPTVINDFLPSLTLSVSWSNGHAKLGNTIKPKSLEEQPSISLDDITSSNLVTKSNMSYVITLTDPDAPSRTDPKWSEMCHWIATNVSISQQMLKILPLPEFEITGYDQSMSSDPDTIIEYKPPGPPPKTGKHRYVFLVFAPKNCTTEPLHLIKPKERQHWGSGEEGGGVKEWALKNELVPVAANFIYSKNKKQ